MKKLLFVVLLAHCCTFLSAQITISNLSATVHSDNVLRYDVDFTTSTPSAAHVEYGYLNGADTVWNQTSVAPTTSQHSITVVGLRSQTPYFFRAQAYNAGACQGSTTDMFTTAALPFDINFPSIDTVFTLPGSDLQGYFLVNAHPTVYKSVNMFDRDGELIWYEPIIGDATDRLCQAFSLCGPNSVCLLSCDSVVEVAFDGTRLMEADVHAANANMYPYQDAIQNSNGNIVSMVAVKEIVDRTSVGGTASDTVIGPGLVELDSAGNTIWTWSAFDHYMALEGPLANGYWNGSNFGSDALDWKHANSLVQDQDGTYMVAMTLDDHVIKLSSTTGTVLFTCGMGGNIEIMVADSFLKPFSIDLGTSGNYVMFDNDPGNTPRRAIDWWIDWGYAVPTMMIDRSFAPAANAWNSGPGVTIERLPSNNSLVAWQGGGLYEFDLARNEMWFAGLNAPPRKVNFVGDLYTRAALSYGGSTLYCIADTAETLLATPQGGQWFGPGFTNGIFDASAAGAGTHTVYYKYGTDTLPVSLMVDADPDCSTPVTPGSSWNLHFAAFPNPFSDQLRLCYTLVEKTDMQIALYALDGRRLATVFEGTQAPGDQNLELDVSGLGLPAGAVVLRMQSGDGAHSARLLMHGR